MELRLISELIWSYSKDRCQKKNILKKFKEGVLLKKLFGLLRKESCFMHTFESD